MDSFPNTQYAVILIHSYFTSHHTSKRLDDHHHCPFNFCLNYLICKHSLLSVRDRQTHDMPHTRCANTYKAQYLICETQFFSIRDMQTHTSVRVLDRLTLNQIRYAVNRNTKSTQLKNLMESLSQLSSRVVVTSNFPDNYI